MMPELTTRNRRVLLGFILLFAFVLRVWDLNWDEGTHQHPDERYWSIVADYVQGPGSLGEYFDTEASVLNPYNKRSPDPPYEIVPASFVYGTAPLFTTMAVADFLDDGPQPAGAIVSTLDRIGIDLLRDDGTNRFDTNYNINLIGRLLSALIDTGTVFLVYLLARRLFDVRVGLVAALLMASTVLHVQYAHFFGAEPWAAFFVTAVMLGSVAIAQGDQRLRTIAFTGAMLGLAVASKLNTVVAAFVPCVAILIVGIPHLKPGALDLRAAARTAAKGLGILAVAGVVFRILQPYAFSGLVGLDERFTNDLDYIQQVNTGEGSFPWIFQWIGTTPLLYPLESAFWWGLGPPLAIGVVVGTGLAIHRVVRHQRWELLAPLVLLAAMLGLVAQQFNPLIRYLLPVYPTAVVLAGWAVVHLWDRGQAFTHARRTYLRPVARGAAVGIVALTALWAVAYVNGVYGDNHPRVEATQWISENIAPGSAVSFQSWDDPLPLPVDWIDNPPLEVITFDPFAPDRAINEQGVTKPEQLIANLDRVDYVIEASNKLYDAIPQVPAKYPSTVAYYDALFDGRLGFRRVAEFTSPPSLFGIEIDTRTAEETFTVYDQPVVTIWEKTASWSPDRARAILNPAQATIARDVVPAESSTNVLQLRPDELSSIQQGGTFSEIFDDDGLTSNATWLWWLLFLQLAAFAVLPWSMQLFERLPDRGYGLTKILGLVAVALPVWLTVSWNIVDFGATIIWFWFAALIAAGAAGWWRRRGHVTAFLNQNRAMWVTTELVFLTAFFVVVWMRWVNPDLWEAFLGGEKPMELAYLTAISRTTELPAYDPWFAGGAMNYYYMGWFLVAVPIRALKVLPQIGFNLGLATFAAVTATTVFSSAHNLAALAYGSLFGTEHGTGVSEAAPDAVTPAPPSRRRRIARSPITAGVAGVGLLMIQGNWAAVDQHIDRLQSVNTWGEGPGQGGFIGFLGGLRAWIGGADLPQFDWWGPSRVNGSNGSFDITEFPYFSFLFGDLHPHLMGLVFVGLTLAVALALVLSAQAGDRGRSVGLAAAAGVVTGLSRTTNTWDLPTVLIVSVSAVALGHLLAPVRTAEAEREWLRPLSILLAALGLATFASHFASPGGGIFLLVAGGIGVLGGAAACVPAELRVRLLRIARDLAVVAVVHVVVFWPYLHNTETFSVGLQRAAIFTPFDGFLTHYGTFVVIAALFAGSLWLADRDQRAAGSDVPLSLLGPDKFMPALFWLVIVSIWVGLALSTAAAVAAGLVMALSFLFVRELLRPDRAIPRLFSLGLFIIGFGIAAGVDVITVENDIERMNTVFKFWLQAWQLLALASAYAIWHIGAVLATRQVRATATDPTREAQGTRVLRGSWRGAVTVLVIVGLAYPALATGERLDRRFAYGESAQTLDGLAYLEGNPSMPRLDDCNNPDPAQQERIVYLADDLPLITFLREEVQGTPTIVEWAGSSECAGGIYEWHSRMAITSGLPTVLGWDWHQQQQRWGFQDMIFQRTSDVQALYTSATPESITNFLRTYGVTYVVVGLQEHRFGTEESLAQIALHPALDEVARSGPNAIYQVNLANLWPGLDAATQDLLAIGGS